MPKCFALGRTHAANHGCTPIHTDFFSCHSERTGRISLFQSYQIGTPSASFVRRQESRIVLLPFAFVPFTSRQRHSANVPSEETMLQRHIDATDQQIDKLVYEFYGLTDEEIGIVEETAKK